MKRVIPALIACALIASCGIEFPELTTPQPQPWPGPWPGQTPTTTEVTLAAGLTELQPEAIDTISATVNLSRFGITSFDRVYDLETPAGEDFMFSAVGRGAGNFGLTQVSLGHVADGGNVPLTGIESIAAAGMTLEATGINSNGNLAQVNGDGFARATIRGRISAEQVLLLEVPRANDTLHIGVRVRIGNQSAINLGSALPGGLRPGITRTPVFSSDAWQFGLPSIAVSGDRYSLVSYDGNSSTSSYTDRQRRWLQYDAQLGSVTGGSASSMTQDSGNWRDQEITALGNVLAVACVAGGELRAEISLDRGASFGLTRVLDPYAWSGQRLVQIAIAPDYRIGALWWRTMYPSSSNPVSELVLLEATPTGFDSNNTPIGYNWGALTVLHQPFADVTPLLMHLEYSSAGDLAVGYGYTLVDFLPGTWQMRSSARFRCAVRLSGQAFVDAELDREDNIMPADPHVCVLGSGSSMEIFYAYEKSNGIHLLHSTDAGQTFAQAAYVPHPGAFQPSVHARMQGTEKRVDLLFVAPVGFGAEVQCVHWQDFGVSTPAVSRITECVAVVGGSPSGMPPGYDVTSVAWFGYDSVIKGDDVAVVVHEVTFNTYEYSTMWGWTWWTPAVGVAAGASGGSGGSSAPPPPVVLLPGMTGTVAAPNAAHRNQLAVIVLD